MIIKAPSQQLLGQHHNDNNNNNNNNNDTILPLSTTNTNNASHSSSSSSTSLSPPSLLSKCNLSWRKLLLIGIVWVLIITILMALYFSLRDHEGNAVPPVPVIPNTDGSRKQQQQGNHHVPNASPSAPTPTGQKYPHKHPSQQHSHQQQQQQQEQKKSSSSQQTDAQRQQKDSSQTTTTTTPDSSSTNNNNNQKQEAFPQITPKPLEDKKSNIFFFAGNSFIQYQVLQEMSRHSVFEYHIDAAYLPYKLTKQSKDSFRNIRGNTLRELPWRSHFFNELKNADLCTIVKNQEHAAWSKIKKSRFIVLTSEELEQLDSSSDCLKLLLPLLSKDQLVVILNSWKNAYQPTEKGSTDSTLNEPLSEDGAKSLLSSIPSTEYKCKVVELIHSEVLGDFSIQDSDIVHQWAHSLTTNQSLVYYKLPASDEQVSSQSRQVKRDYVHRRDLSTALHLTFQAAQEGRLTNQHEMINIASGKSVAQIRVLSAVQEAFALTPVSLDVREYRSSLPAQARFSIDKAKQLLGFYAEFDHYSTMVQEYQEWYAEFFFPSTFSMSTYLIVQGDPQRSKKKYRCEFNRMKDFFTSVHNVARSGRGFTVFIFHDGCSDDWTRDIETAHLRFHKVPSTNYKRNSPNDERFYMFENFLTDAQQRAPSADYVPTHVLWTDLFDVWINRNPFDFMKNYEDEKRKLHQEQKYYLYPGRDNDKEKVLTHPWMISHVKKCNWYNEMKSYEEAPLMNAGVCGGQFASVLRLVHYVGEELSSRPKHENCNMPAYNLCLSKYFGPENYRTGVPFTSPFWKKSRDPKYYICHK